MDKYTCLPHISLLFIDICKQKCTFAGVEIYFYLARKPWITAIARNWSYHKIERRPMQPYMKFWILAFFLFWAIYRLNVSSPLKVYACMKFTLENSCTLLCRVSTKSC